VALGSFSKPDPKQARTEDLKLFRQHVMALRAELMIEEQLARQLVKSYDERWGAERAERKRESGV
jgi:hypothetical protein